MRAQAYQVIYRVRGRDYAAGPYREDEVDYHRDDIRTYDGVEFAYAAVLLPLSLPSHEAAPDGGGV